MFGFTPGSLEFVFALCAGVGTLIFVVRFLVGFLTGDMGLDIDDGGGIDGHSDLEFKFLSLNSISGFLMVFGWAGLTARVQFELGPFISCIVATSAGLVMMVLITLMLQAALKLQDSGSVFKIEDTIGKRAKVYQRIPVTGSGVIQIHLPAGNHQLNAVSEGEVEISSFETVVVVSVVNENTVIVKTV